MLSVAKEDEHFFPHGIDRTFLFLLRSVCVSLPICSLDCLLHLLFNVLGFFANSVRCVSGKVYFTLCRESLSNSLLCRNFKHITLRVLTCLCVWLTRVYVFVYLCVLGSSDLSFGETVCKNLWFKENDTP